MTPVEFKELAKGDMMKYRHYRPYRSEEPFMVVAVQNDGEVVIAMRTAYVMDSVGWGRGAGGSFGSTGAFIQGGLLIPPNEPQTELIITKVHGDSAVAVRAECIRLDDAGVWDIVAKATYRIV